ncbi:hypothetical protein GJ496_011919 [Pomphorhynchus laevis]|nr:hypothetical protein GJ496_011919 [Pomphorhynchus laevis]
MDGVKNTISSLSNQSRDIQALITETASAALSPFVNLDNWTDTNVINAILPFNTVVNPPGALISVLYSTCINVNQDAFNNVGHGMWRVVRKVEGRKGELIDDLANLIHKEL